MFKKFLTNVKSTVKNCWDEVNDELDLENYETHLTVADTSFSCFEVNEYICITFHDDIIRFENDDEDGFSIEMAHYTITDTAFLNTTVKGVPFRGTYIEFLADEEVDYIYLKAEVLEPHFFLEAVQRLRIADEINHRRYARTATSAKQLCDGCGAIIHEANCPHCGLTNTMVAETIGESNFEYNVDPIFRANLQLYNSSIENFAEDASIYYHVYEDCIALRARGSGENYHPKNIIILFEYIVNFSLKEYKNTDEAGLYIEYKDGGKQFVHFKTFASKPKAPLLNLEYAKADFNIQDIFDAIDKEDGVPQRLCEYCGLGISTSICPHCGGVN